jgi:two-component system CheB/CheR fusion protein
MNAWPESGDAPHSGHADGHSGRILVVDDNRDAAEALADLLVLDGWEVTVACTGGEGLESARSANPDAIILDLDLPDVSGYEVATKLRAEPELAEKLIVAVSGFGHEQAKERSRRSGIDHHLTKPISLNQLLALLNR